MNVDLRCLVQSQYRVVVEITLHDTSMLDGNLGAQCSGQTEVDATLNRRSHAVWVDGKPAVDGSDHTQHLDRAVLEHTHFGDLCMHRASPPTGDTTTVPLGQRRTPPRRIGRKLQHGPESFCRRLMLGQQVQPKL